MLLETLASLDRGILLFFQNNVRGVGVIDWIMVFFSTIGNAGAVWLLLIALLLIFRRTRRSGFNVLLSLAICWSLCELIIKPTVQRPRPFLTIPELEVLIISPPTSFSFPSGHTASSFACACVCVREFGKKGYAAYAVAVIIAVSRMYLGVHYPSDVLTSVLIAGLGSIGVYALNRRFIPEKFLR